MTYFTICLWCCILLVRINISWILKNLGLVETMHWYCLTHLALLRLDIDIVWLTWPCWDYTLTQFDWPSHVETIHWHSLTRLALRQGINTVWLTCPCETGHWHSLTDLAMLRLDIDTVWLTLPWDRALTQFDSPGLVETRHWHSLTDLAMLRLHIDTVWFTLPWWDYTLTQFDSPCHVETTHWHRLTHLAMLRVCCILSFSLETVYLSDM